MILLASHVVGGRPDQRSFAAVDITVRRNGYGRQVDSFETDLYIVGLELPFHAVFIRAPKVVAIGANVEVLAEYDGVPVVARQGHVMVASFHPELTGDARLHAKFLLEV
jgi:5'-phosphate synthase pdxT subunit